MTQRGRRGEGERRGHGEGQFTELPDGRIRWRVRVTLRSGETKRPNGTAPNIKAARAAVREAIKAAESGTLVDRSKVTVEEHLTAWLRGLDTIRPRTRDLYANYLRLHIGPGIGGVRLTALTAARLRDFYAALREEKGLGDSSRRHVHNILHAALAQACGDGLLATNPAALPGVRPKTVAVRERKLKAFTPEEAAKFYHTASQHRGGVLLAFMLVTGLRRGEALGLKWDAVNLETGVIEVRVTRSQSDGEIYENEPKTASGRRTITVKGDALALLCEHRTRTLREREARLAGYEVTPYVFTTLRGTPYRPDNIGRLMRQMCEKAQVRQLSPHALRHTFVSVAAARGANVSAISAHVGHASAAFTLAQYRHAYPEESVGLSLDFGLAE